MHESEDFHPFAGEITKPHDVDLGDGHWLDWATYEEEKCGGIITHVKTEELKTQQRAEYGDQPWIEGYCQGAFTIRGSKWHQVEPKRSSWEFDGNLKSPTLSPSFLCHCGDHGFIRNGKWVRA
jgi:hypothetical protein